MKAKLKRRIVRKAQGDYFCRKCKEPAVWNVRFDYHWGTNQSHFWCTWCLPFKYSKAALTVLEMKKPLIEDFAA